MQNKRAGEHGSEIALDDIYFVLFRHKWKIIICSIIGFITAAALFMTRPQLYQSEAKLYIKYVNEGNVPSTLEAASEVRPAGADNIINSELEILKSMDIAQRVVTNIGAEKILAKWGGGNDTAKAALLINQHLDVQASRLTVVVHLIFQHPDPSLVQPILREIINCYMDEHREVHNPSRQWDDFLQTQKDAVNSTLTQVLAELKQARKGAGVIDIDTAREILQQKKLKLKEELANIQMAREAEQLKIEMLKSNEVAAARPEKVTNSPTAEAPAEKIEEYKAIAKRFDKTSELYEDRKYQYTDENPLVKEALAQKTDAEKRKTALEKEYPSLKKIDVSTTAKDNDKDKKTGTGDLPTETERLAAIQLRIKFLVSQLAEIDQNAAAIDDAEVNILQLEKQKKDAEDRLANFSHSWEQSKIQQQIAAEKMPNIKPIQQPSTPTLELSKTDKLTAMVAVGGILLGLAWAFLIEFGIDRSVKRPKDIEHKLGLPLFLSIPDARRKNYLNSISAGENPLLLKDMNESLATEETTEPEHANGAAAALPVQKNGSAEVATYDASQPLHPFYEALRNRLLGFFEVNKVVHNPKLVAVTGCSKNAGASTIAMGLAASLSETGDGNVLLVDMNLEQGGAQQFYRGKLRLNLDDVLQKETREGAMVQENLYVANANGNGDKISRMLPKKFAKLVPQLKASDYDYIIFDMPPVSRSGVTQRLTSFMDMTLLVVEAEKSSRDVVRQASAVLKESNAHVSVVLNKTRTYIPHRLHQEF